VAPTLRSTIAALLSALVLVVLPGAPVAADDAGLPLEEPAHGQAAIDDLGDHLDDVAHANGMTEDELEDQLTEDDTLWVDEGGALFYVDPPRPGRTPRPSATGDALVGTPQDAFALHSRPGSSRVIYLDFDGQVISNGAWTALPLAVPAFDTDLHVGTFSDDEQAFIADVWARVAEDYAPFDVDVTTQDPGDAAIHRTNLTDTRYGTRLLVVGRNSILWATACGEVCGGVAYLDVFDAIGSQHSLYQPALVFQDAMSGVDADPKDVAEAASHEIGHNLSLDHDGVSGDDYYAGHGSWAPIMGVGYERPIVQFSKGEYPGADNREDDLAKIASAGAPLLADDHGNTAATATVLAGTTTFSATGVITGAADVDAFQVSIGAGSTTIDVAPATTSPNLDVLLRVYTGSTLLQTVNPASGTSTADVATGMGASLTTTLATGTYTLLVSGTGAGTTSTGYSSYGSVGRYTVSVDGVPPPPPNLTVSAVGNPPATANTGSTFAASDTTANDGGAAGASQTAFWLSTDGTRDGGDVALTGTRTVGALASSTSSSGTTTVTIGTSTTPGTYRVIACADASSAVSETNESDNCRASTGTVTVAVNGPDLVVTSVGNPPAAISSGSTITVRDVTSNSGTTTAGASRTQHFLSLDQTKDGTDRPLGVRSLKSLLAGRTSAASIKSTIATSTPAGTYYVLACADVTGAVVERSEANNCLASASRVVVSPKLGDLVVTAVGKPPAGAEATTAFTITDPTRNQGTATASASTTTFWLSTDASAGGGDIVLGSHAVASLKTSGSKSSSTTVTIGGGTTPGAYYVVACADAGGAVTELDDANNCRASATTIAVRAATPDLVVSSVGKPPSSVARGRTLSPSSTTRNQGTASAGASTTSVWLSTDKTRGSDVALGVVAVGSLAPRTNASTSTSVTIGSGVPTGSYYVLVCADDAGVVSESVESNNCTASSARVKIT
jgi:hypothetical protein